MKLLLFIQLFSIPFVGFAQQIKWQRTSYSFGSVSDWNSPPASFRFKNVGNSRLMFLPQKHRRDVLVIYPDHAILPGEEGEIIIQYYTSETGPFARTVEVYSNASDRPVRLTLRGSIKNIYANALTACPSFRNDQQVQTSHYNIVVVVDRATGEPITGARIELLERNKRKSVSLTSKQGRSTNRVERGKYLAIVTKDGYRKAEQELYFEKGTGVHVVYLDRDELRVEESRVTGYELREEIADVRPEITSNSEEEEFDLGISTNDQWEEKPQIESEELQVPSSELRDDDQQQIEVEEEFNLGINTNDQWEEKPQVESEKLREDSYGLREKKDPQSKVEELDLGINTDSQWEEELRVESEELRVDTDETADVRSIAVEEEPAIAEPEFSEKTYRPNNVLLLLDVSGSMKEDDKMTKLKSSLRRLILMLREVDVLTLIAYNSTSWEVLPPTPVKDNQAIVALMDSLQPYGYTNGVKGMETAYESLRSQLIDGGNNQLIIATDGKFNSSKFSERDAIQLVKTNSDKGIVLSIIGFGNDREATQLMRRLAKEGNGSFLQVNKDRDPTELLAEEIKTRSRKL